MPKKSGAPVVPGGATPPNNPNRFKTPAQREAERQAASYAGRAQQEYKSPAQIEAERQAQSYTGRTMQDYIQNQSSDLVQPMKNALTNFLSGQRYAGQAAQSYNPNSPTPVAPQDDGRSPGAGNSSYVGGGGSASPQPTLEDQLAAIQGITGTIDPTLKALVPTTGELEVMYGRLTDSLNQSKAGLDTDYQKAIDAIKSNFGASNNMLNQAISGDNASLAQAAKSLGVDNWAAGPTAQGQTDMLNNLLGANSANQATDLSWFEKMRNLDQSQFADYLALANMQKQGAVDTSQQRMVDLQEMANEVARNQAMLALQESLGASGGGSGGGGYGGGRGGGSFSGKAKDAYRTLTQSATQTGDLDFAGFLDQINQLPPALKDIAVNYWVMGGASGKGAAKAIQQDILRGVNTFGGDPASLEYLFNMMLGYTPGTGVIYNQTTQDKTSQSTKQYGVPPITQLAGIPSGGSGPSLATIAKSLKDSLKGKGASTPPKAKTPPKSVLDKLF